MSPKCAAFYTLEFHKIDSIFLLSLIVAKRKYLIVNNTVVFSVLSCYKKVENFTVIVIHIFKSFIKNYNSKSVYSKCSVCIHFHQLYSIELFCSYPKLLLYSIAYHVLLLYLFVEKVFDGSECLDTIEYTFVYSYLVTYPYLGVYTSIQLFMYTDT